MELWAVFLIALVIMVVIGLIYRCCCRTMSRGRVLAPPTNDTSATQPPYPQQQYTAPYIGPAGAARAPYPTHEAFPVPQQPAPYPTHNAFPVPQQPAPLPYQPGLFPAAATAPADARPPTYEQAVGASDGKQPPYNPNAPM